METSGSPNLERPVAIEEGIYWVGARDEFSRLQCNPYLLVEGDKAVLIDGGSRTNFATVMMKILQAGVDLQNIIALIYQHPDPDLCGSMPNILDLCRNPDLKVISMASNHLFIQYYIDRQLLSMLEKVEDLDFMFSFNGRRLRFIPTPYAHSAGSFATYDERTGTLFSSDLFGSLCGGDLFINLDEKCALCSDMNLCRLGRDRCPVEDILEFHRQVMPTRSVITYALEKIGKLDVHMLAPQHGNVIQGGRDVGIVMDLLRNIDQVGIDRLPAQQ